MIKRSELRPVGTLLKTHGIDGEIVVQLTADVDLEALQCIVLEIDGIFVPFFPTSVRPKSAETDLVSIDGVDVGVMGQVHPLAASAAIRSMPSYATSTCRPGKAPGRRAACMPTT